jgi:hypothetical protein
VRDAATTAGNRCSRKHGLTFQPLTEVDWQVYRFKSPLLKLNQIFPEGIQIPAIYPDVRFFTCRP